MIEDLNTEIVNKSVCAKLSKEQKRPYLKFSSFIRCQLKFIVFGRIKWKDIDKVKI